MRFFHVFWEIDVRCGFAANIPPFSLPKSTKIFPKIDPKRHQIFDRCLDRFLLIWARCWRPTWSHVGHFFAQKSAGLTDPGGLFIALPFFLLFRVLDPILAPFWPHFGTFGHHFASILEAFGSMIAPCWHYVGPFGRKSWHWTGWCKISMRFLFIRFHIVQVFAVADYKISIRCL